MWRVVQQGLRRIGGALWNGGVSRPGPYDAAWTRRQVGRWGESWAAWHYYRTRGGAILARNWRGGGGELDLIVREGEELVFVEVKTRDPSNPEPLAQVRDAKRQRHFRAAASAWRARLPRPRPPVRFDVLLVTPDPERPEQPQIDCLVAALSDVELEEPEGVV